MDIALTLEYKPGVPLYRQLAEALKECILSGRLKPGEFLPSTRDMAKMLGASRVTVVRSYEELVSQGFLIAATGRGTCVARRLPEEAQRVAMQMHVHHDLLPERKLVLSKFGKRLMQQGCVRSGSADLPELNYGAPPSEHLPVTKWREMLLRYSRGVNDHAEVFEDEDPMGYRPLRDAIASYLSRARGVKCRAEQVAVFSGAQHALNLIARLLIDEGDSVVVENPGFPQAREQFALNGAEVIPVAVDECGLQVNELRELNDCKAAYVTPSHQDPTGAVLPLERRTDLLRWARKTGAFIIEDDFDSEYRYGGKAVPALQGLDESESVIYLSTFWKVLFPLLPVGYLVVPHCLIPCVARAKLLTERTFPLLEQLALTDFIQEGHLERHIRRSRDVYAKRRQALIFALTTNFGKALFISKESAGMHVLVRFATTLSDDELLACAVKAEVPMVSTSDYYVDGERQGEFMIGFAAVDGEIIAEKVAALANLIKDGEQVAV
ncbi:MAG TPA: PLP-dependent aminotransferase family protein [Candidatus Obscuribacterales bacterium]